VKAAASSAAAAGIQVHICPTAPTGTPAARGTHTAQVIPKASMKKAVKGRLRIDRATIFHLLRALCRDRHTLP
jgi:hypothetical protein